MDDVSVGIGVISVPQDDNNKQAIATHINGFFISIKYIHKLKARLSFMLN
jgi:hypothetical protein